MVLALCQERVRHLGPCDLGAVVEEPADRGRRASEPEGLVGIEHDRLIHQHRLALRRPANCRLHGLKALWLLYHLVLCDVEVVLYLPALCSARTRITGIAPVLCLVACVIDANIVHGTFDLSYVRCRQ